MKKYSGVYEPLIKRLSEENPDIKTVKTKLHQVYGAYTQDNAHKKAAKLLDNYDGAATAMALLALHASTKERLPHYDDFYNFIFQYTGKVDSILDIGCGYNPFSLPLIPKLQKYFAYDIDTRVADLLNRFFLYEDLPPKAKCADLAVEIPKDTADLALMCKLIPVLESQATGSGFLLARSLNVKHLLITYPLKSLGGREKGMEKNYTAAFEKAMEEGQLSSFTLVANQKVGSEILYLLTKQ
ncbi:MAG: hypothetical protein FWE11_02185 [Defluviitaleaceae bacterium]|nr:hypothetical protein [Defluviitaleaceae bacterium]